MDDNQLAQLLGSRPALAELPAPGFETLAERAARAGSLERCLDGLRRLAGLGLVWLTRRAGCCCRRVSGAAGATTQPGWAAPWPSRATPMRSMTQKPSWPINAEGSRNDAL